MYILLAILLLVSGYELAERAIDPSAGGLLPSPTVAPAHPSGRVLASVGAVAGLSGGDVGFQIDFQGALISDLEFDVDGTVYGVCVDAALVDRPGWGLHVRGRYLRDGLVEGETEDTDWDIDGEVLHYSESDSEADVEIWDADLLLVMRTAFARSGWAAKQTAEIGLFAGYASQAFDFDVENLRGSYFYGAVPVSLKGDVSTYRAEFEGVRVGGHLVFEVLQRLRLGVEFGVIPGLKARGDGNWLLRDLTFRQKAKGLGETWGVTAGYRIQEHFELFAAYRVTNFRADKDGVETGNEGGQEYFNEPIVREITAQYEVGEVGVAVSF